MESNESIVIEAASNCIGGDLDHGTRKLDLDNNQMTASFNKT
jgi:hypothetical protein